MKITKTKYYGVDVISEVDWIDKDGNAGIDYKTFYLQASNGDDKILDHFPTNEDVELFVDEVLSY